MLDPHEQFERDAANDDPTVSLTPEEEAELVQRLDEATRQVRVARAKKDAAAEVAGDPDDDPLGLYDLQQPDQPPAEGDVL
jgi:hypothetical protein